MDDPALDPALHQEALQGLARLNQFSGSAQVMLQPIAALMQARNLAALKVLDIATGSGDIPLALTEAAQGRKLDLRVDGCDFSEVAVSQASKRAENLGSPSKFFKLDVLADQFPSGYDVITSSLFMHHLDPPEVTLVLGKMKAAAKHMILVNDLVRGYDSLCMVFLGTRLLSRSPVVHFDGIASVHASYTISEMKEMSKLAGLHEATVEPRFPCRMLLTWRK